MNDEGATKLGIPVDQVGQIGRETFLKILCLPAEDPVPGVAGRWTDLADLVLGICENEVEVTWEKLSMDMASRFYGRDRWQEMPLGQRIAWEGAVRMMANLCVAEGVEDQREINRFDWRAWARDKLEKESDEQG